MPKTERKTHTPADRATAALGVEQRRVDKLQSKKLALTAELDELQPEIDAAVARRDYLAKHPDLPANHTQPIPEVDAVAGPVARKGRAVRDEPQA